MNLYQLYKDYKINKIKQIYKYNNPANFITKVKISSALKILMDTNYINISIVKQANIKQINVIIK